MAKFISQQTFTAIRYLLSPLYSFYLNQLFPTGPSHPLQPSNLMSTDVRHNRATIHWTVSRVTYTPETYTVHFGNSSGSLTSFSQQRQSGDNFTATNLQFSVQLTGLSAGTTYYYQVEARNSQPGSTQSTVQQFTTREQRKLICFVHAIPLHYSCQYKECLYSLDWTTGLTCLLQKSFLCPVIRLTYQ